MASRADFRNRCSPLPIVSTARSATVTDPFGYMWTPTSIANLK